jgi:FixJ family two-component response regulator
MPLIFILDDDDDILFAMEFWLKRKGYSVESFVNAVQMLQGIKERMPDIFLLDVYLNGEDGRKICKYLKKEEDIKKPVFLFSNHTDCSNDFQNYQADGFMEKPFSMKEFAATIKRKLMF